MESGYEVIVLGAGPAGLVAAIQSARAGARTLLVEKGGICGGTLVTGGIPYPASFYAHDTQIITGIGWELCCRAREELGQPIPGPVQAGPQSTGCLHFQVNPAIFAALADEMLLAAGAEVLFHAMPAAVCTEGNSWHLTVCAKTGLRSLRAGILVDCTGDANLVELAGLELRQNPELQAATLVVQASGYDAAALDYEAIQAAFEKEVAAGRMRRSDPGWDHGRIDFFLRSYGGNRIHVPEVNARTSEGKTLAELAGRQAMLRLLRFCRRQPGLENFVIDSCSPECGIRETATIRGKKQITIQDYESGRLWPDAICYSFYGVDIHRADHVAYRVIKPGVYPTIPLGAMLPAGSRRIIVAGRCVAGDWEASSAYRVEASCMAMGQAAGAAAALAAKLGADFEEVPLEKLHTLLRRHGAIVPGDLGKGD